MAGPDKQEISQVVVDGKAVAKKKHRPHNFKPVLIIAMFLILLGGLGYGGYYGYTHYLQKPNQNIPPEQNQPPGTIKFYNEPPPGSPFKQKNKPALTG